MKTRYDVIVVGGGPAGLTAGIAASMRGLDVLIAEKMDRPCRKLLITGKGRCNVTNNCDTETFMQNIRAGARFLYSSYSAFGAQDVMSFFEEHGVPLKTERGNRVYPKSDRSSDIADALIQAAKQAGCELVCATAEEIITKEEIVCGVKFKGLPPVECRAVIVATGGLSYPKTGSTGDGYRFARQAGHTVTPLKPSLVPLTCKGDDCPKMMGLSLRNVKLTARQLGKIFFSEQGEMIFTHFGVSGPLILSLSGLLAERGLDDLNVCIDLKPALDRQMLDRRILRDFEQNINREFCNSLDALLPKKMIPVVVQRCGIDPHKRVHAVTVSERAALIDTIKEFQLDIDGTRPIDEAVVTAGGVTLKEIDPRSMMSKKIKNLHFAGEVLDADGFTGGFNLGIAFATGHAAGSYVLKEAEQ